MVDDDDDDDDDPFWMIALDDRREGALKGHDNDEDSSDVEEEDSGSVARPKNYRIPIVDDGTGNNNNNNNDDDDIASTILRLCPLPPTDGVWSPVGAHAWYASALLASLLLLWNPDKNQVDHSLHRHPFNALLTLRSSTNSVNKNGGNPRRTIIELGSGAVGLSGFVCALALQYWLKNLPRESHHTEQENWRVLLTDNDAAVLDQLRRNLHNNQSTIMPLGATVHVEVDAWDWNHKHPDGGQLSNEEVLLVIGSELVYTQETAEACVQLLLYLLNQHPAVEIWVLQVTDRFGWLDVVVPTLLSKEILVESIPILLQHHELASTMVPMGGTLDRHAYGAFCIHQKSTTT